MDTTADATAVLRLALQDFAHELHYKSTHFKGLKKHYTRAAMDGDISRFAADPAIRVGVPTDPFSGHLYGILATLPDSLTELEGVEMLDRWERAETTINCRLKALIGCVGPEATGRLMAALLPALGVLPPLTLHAGRRPVGTKRSDGRLGQPDLILRHPSMMLSVEMKVRGGRASAKYDAQQHFKYLRLGAEVREEAGGNGFRTVHILLAPLAGGVIAKRAARWLDGPVADRSALCCLPDGLIDLLSAERKAQAAALGGERWVDEAQQAMPMHCLELARFLDAADLLTTGSAPEQVELRRQIEAVRRYGLPTPKPSRRKSKA